MSEPEYVVVVPADTAAPCYPKVLTRGTDQGTLSFFQHLVGGYIEVVPALLLNRAHVRWQDVSICLNEEGKLTGLPYNSRASAWYAPLHDSIMGNVVLIGPPDDEGNTTGFTKEQAQALTRVVGKL